MSHSIYLFQLLNEMPQNDAGMWKVLLEKRLEETGYQYERVGNKLRIWEPPSPVQKTPQKGVFYRDGVEVLKISMPASYDKTAIGFSFARLYFLEGETYPAFQSSKELFKNSNFPPVLRQLPLLNKLDTLICKLNEKDALFTPVESIDWECVSPSVYVESTNKKIDVFKMSEGQYASSILGMVRGQRAQQPVNFELALIDAFVENKDKATHVATSTSNVLMNEWGCGISKRKISSKDEFEQWCVDEDKAKVGFFALDGKKGQRPDQRAIEWMRRMEEVGIPYTLFSAGQDVNPTYTRHGNAMHLLTKAGGTHFTVTANSVGEYHNHWFIGLDLGYGNQYKGKCAVVTLNDANGNLKCYWRAIKDPDDTLPPDLLEEALLWIIDKAESMQAGQNYIVIRDGRCPHNETIGTYKNLLPEGRSVFLEYTKTSNPVMLKNGYQPDPGTLAIPSGSSQPFIFTAKASQKDMLTNTTRFRIRINDLEYTLEQLGEILTAQCFAPKLSFQPASLPAPIYWADGIASLSNVNLQFAGWGHLPSVTRDFRT